MEALKVFISYSHKDEELKEELEKHLSNLKNQGKIDPWQDRQIEAGTEWDPQIKAALENADIILLLISADFIASDYINNVELNRALERHQGGTARVVPVILRKTDLKATKIAELQSLPKDAKPVTLWENQDEAFNNVVEGIRSVVKTLNAKEITTKPLIPKKINLTEEDWQSLFANFLEDDFPYVLIAFPNAFKSVLGEFRRIRPDYPPLRESAQIQQLLKTYDNPELAVRFVERIIEELQQASEGTDRDLTTLKQWQDRIQQKFNVPPPAPTPAPTTARHAYLLVAVEQIGSDVNVYPELHITGTEKPINFGAKPTTCPADEVADRISEWIQLAENALDDTCEDEEVTLEVFLPYKYLEVDIAATWSVKDKRGRELPLENHRKLLVRSSDRIGDRQIQKALIRKWEILEACVRANNACSKFHLQEDCPKGDGTLCASLKDGNAPGLKLIGKLPTDPKQRTNLLLDIINAAIPIALWPSQMADADANTLNIEFNNLLNCQLTNFLDLARQWRTRRRDSTLAKHIRLLCDRPDRWPNPPDPNQEEDLLVAS